MTRACIFGVFFTNNETSNLSFFTFLQFVVFFSNLTLTYLNNSSLCIFWFYLGKNNAPSRKRKKIMLPFFRLNRDFKCLFFSCFVLLRLFFWSDSCYLKDFPFAHSLVITKRKYYFLRQEHAFFEDKILFFCHKSRFQTLDFIFSYTWEFFFLNLIQINLKSSFLRIFWLWIKTNVYLIYRTHPFF